MVMVAHPYNPNNQEAEAGGSQNRDMPGVDRIFKVSLNSKTRLCRQNRKHDDVAQLVEPLPHSVKAPVQSSASHTKPNK